MRELIFVVIILSINQDKTVSSDSSSQNNNNNNEKYPTASLSNFYQTSSNHFDGNNFDFDDDDETKSSYRGPYFDITASKNVTALVGNTAYLNCRIRNLENRTVTWIRHRDLHLLTVGKSTYTPDQRFQSVHNPQSGDWSLKILYPQKQDSGIYECQISTTPPVGYSIMLQVVEPITTIVGGPDLYIDTGSTINLTCVVQQLPEPPPGMTWTHNGVEINYDSTRGGVSVITEKGDITTSYLLIQRAQVADSGKYTCSPSSANPATINVHVLNGEHPAAIQGGSKLQIKFNMLSLVFIILIATRCIR